MTPLDLPRTSHVNDDEGTPPEREPTYAPALVNRWMAQRQRERKLRATSTTRLWYSDAGWCARKISYEILDAEITNPDTAADYWRMELGVMVHNEWQQVMTDILTGLGHMVATEARSNYGVASGKADMAVWYASLDGDERGGVDDVVELKSKSGMPFKIAVGDRRPPAGPRMNEVLQLGFSVLGLGAPGGVLIYLATEGISEARSREIYNDPGVYGRFTAEWRYTADQLRPIVDAEADRLAKIQTMVDQGTLAPRHAVGMPHGARVVNPHTGHWKLLDPDGGLADQGRLSICTYPCKFRDRCVADLEAGL